MALVSPLLAGFLAFLAANGGMCFDIGGGGGGDMEEEELYGLFEVMGSLLEDPTWAQMHPVPCTDTPWPGVECELLEETSTFHVTKIHVGADVITPPCKASASISESLLELPYLKTLSLMDCFTDSSVSLSNPVLGALSFLEHLALESNPSLSGQIPPSISNLTNLKVLCLSQNNLSGEIPKEIGKLVNLEELDLSHNSLTGQIPEEIGSLERLTILDLSWNSLRDELPDTISGLQSLEKIDLSSNRLQGRLPVEMGKLKRLELLDLSHNSLTGPVPESLSGLQQLQYLIMEDNPLNASIPSFIGSLIQLTVVSLSGCRIIGAIPSTFSSLTNLTALSLDNNNLNGTVPPELEKLRRLDMLNLSGNHLTGELLFPREFINKLGERLDIRENNGLCTDQGTQTPRFLQNRRCSSGARNKTLEDGNSRRSENTKPTLHRGNKNANAHDSDARIILFPGLMFLFLLLSS